MVLINGNGPLNIVNMPLNVHQEIDNINVSWHFGYDVGRLGVIGTKELANFTVYNSICDTKNQFHLTHPHPNIVLATRNPLQLKS
jgi:hypothetical protein